MRARQNPILKGLAFVVAVVSFATAAMLGCYQLANVDVIWGQSSAAEGYTIRYMQQQDAGNISYLVDLYYLEQENGALNSYDQQSLSDLKEKYAKENTNLRWQLMDPEGNVLYGNWMEARPTQPQGMYWGEYYVSNLTMDVRNELSTVWADAVNTIRNPPKSSQVVQSKQWARELSDAVNRYWEDPSGGVDRYAVYLDEDGSGDLLRIATNFGVFLYAPSVENVISPNAFGYQYNLDEGGWTQNMESGWTEGSVALDLVLWVNTPLSDIGDKYEKVYNGLTWWKEHNVLLGVGTFVFVALGVWMLVYLCLAAGHSRKSEEVRLNWLHRIPGEFILAGVILLGCYPVSWLVEGIVFYIPYSGMHIGIQMAMAGCGMAALSVLAIVLLMTVSARVKSHTLLTNTLLWRLCSWAWYITSFPL